MNRTMNRAILILSLLTGTLITVALSTNTTAKKKKQAPPAQFFHTSDQCLACHNGLTTPSGEDISIGTDWRSTMMANSARDPYWQGAVRRESMDHPDAVEAIEGECSICHMPMARFTAHQQGAEGEVFAHLPVGQGQSPMDLMAADGVSCTLCHQIQADNLGQPESFVGGFLIDTQTPWGQRSVNGPYDVDQGRKKLMQSASMFTQSQNLHMQESAFCGTCHTLYTNALGPGGEVVGRLPEQMPFLEWQHSSYPQTDSCQDCHMRQVDDPVHISSVWGQPRSFFKQHVFRGGNFLVPRMLNRWRNELGTAATPRELEATSTRTLDHLETSSARVMIIDTAVKGDVLTATVQVENLAGHKLPSAYPSRRAWIQLTVKDGDDKVIFQSGALNPDGSIAGNDNDEDPASYEPHMNLISDPDQVQIYEAILGGPDEQVTTGLLTATHYLKDNRLLPDGFAKADAHDDVAVHGDARGDEDFIGGVDRILYSIPLGQVQGPFEITAQLYYQPIGFRWAMNLAPYDAPEPQAFVGYYQAASGDSATVLATDRALAKPLPTPAP